MFRKQPTCVCLMLLVLAVVVHPAWAQTYQISSNSITFFSSVGNNPLAQNILLFPNTGLNPAIRVSTANGGDWLSAVGATGGLFTQYYQIGLVVRSQFMAIGDYYGQVTVSQSGIAQFPLAIPVHLKVNPPGAYLDPAPGVINLESALGSNPPSTTLIFRSVGSVPSSMPVMSKTSTGGDWIALSAPIASSLSPDVGVVINYNTSSLAAGFYSGVITATAADALDSPINVAVNLKVGSTVLGPALAVSPTALTFNAGTGVNPPAQTISLNNSGQGTISPMIQTSAADGGQWLNVQSSVPASGGSLSLTVTANVGGLANGIYSGSITITDSSAANSPLTIPVTLAVQVTAPRLAVRTNSVAISVAAGSTAQTTIVDVFNSGTGALAFTTSVSTPSGGNWLSVSPTSGATPASLTITANPAGLPAGVYQGKVTVTSSGGSQDIIVFMAVGVRLPTINSNGFVNGASFGSQTLAAGEIASAFGVDFGPAQGTQGSYVGGKLTTQVGGVTLTFDGTPAPLFYTSNFQINAQVPFEVAGKNSTVIQVLNQGLPGPTYTVNLRSADPAVFVDGGRMTVFNQAGQQILPGQGALAGEALTLWATGLGGLTAAVATGAPGPTVPLSNTTITPVITVGGQPALILFSGYAPGFVGLYQVNFRVPAGLPSGDQPLIISVGTTQSTPLQLAIR